MAYEIAYFLTPFIIAFLIVHFILQKRGEGVVKEVLWTLGIGIVILAITLYGAS